MEALMEAFAKWIGNTPPHALMTGTTWAWPAAESIHFIGLSFLMGTVGLFDLRLLGLAKSIPMTALHKLIPFGVMGWLLNLTNDAWYGSTPGPYQHFLQARVRAVEEGLPLVRAANSGISAIVDAHGRVLESLDLERAGVVDGGLPVRLPPTPYGRFGDLIFFVLVVVNFCGALIGKRYRASENI